MTLKSYLATPHLREERRTPKEFSDILAERLRAKDERIHYLENQLNDEKWDSKQGWAAAGLLAIILIISAIQMKDIARYIFANQPEFACYVKKN